MRWSSGAAAMALVGACTSGDGDGDKVSDEGTPEVEETEGSEGTEAPAEPASPLATNTGELQQIVVHEGRVWVQVGARLSEVVGGAIVPQWVGDSEDRGMARELIAAPDGSPWLFWDRYHLDGTDWVVSSGGPGGYIPVDAERTGEVVAVVQAPFEGEYCNDEDGNEIACPLGPQTLQIWSAEGIVSVDVVPDYEAQVAALSTESWAQSVWTAVRDSAGAEQVLDGAVADLAMEADGDVVAGTAAGTVWRGSVGAMVAEFEAGEPIVDVLVRDDLSLVVTGSGQLWAREADLWVEVPVTQSGVFDLLKRVVVDEKGLVHGIGSRCVWEGDLGGLTPVVCRGAVPVEKVEWSGGRLYTGGVQGVEVWGADGLPAHHWNSPPILGFAATDDELQVVTDGGVFRLTTEGSVPVELPGGLVLAGKDDVGFRGRSGYARAGDLWWWFWSDGQGGWRAGQVSDIAGAPILTDDGAEWAAVKVGSHHEVRRRVGEGDWAVVWTGAKPQRVDVVGDHLAMVVQHQLIELEVNGDVAMMGPEDTIVVNPKTAEIWKGAEKWTGAAWARPDIGLPGAPEGFAQDGTAWILDGDLWWTRP